MAIQNEPTRIQIPFADSGTKNVIPDTNSTPSASQAASWTDGFPSQCSLPLSAGGIPPARADFNGIFNTMSQSIRFGQEGGVWTWDATVDYAANRVVLGSDGLLYWSVAQSGPNVGGAQDPTTDDGTYWQAMRTRTMPALDSSAAVATTEWVRTAAGNGALYVDSTNGNDANDGLSQAHAVKTIAQALTLWKNKTGTACINIASGTYAENLDFANNLSASCILYLQGNVTLSGRILIDGVACYIYGLSSTLTIAPSDTSIPISVFDGGLLRVSCNVSATGTNCSNLVLLSGNSTVVCSGQMSIVSNGCSDSCLKLEESSVAFFESSLSVSGTGATNGIHVTESSYLEVIGDYTCSNMLTAGTSAIYAGTNGVCVFNKASFHSSSSGTSVQAKGCSHIIFLKQTTITHHASSEKVVVSTFNSHVSFYSSLSIDVSSGCSTVFAALHTSSIGILSGKLTLNGRVTNATATCSIVSEIDIEAGVTVAGTVTGKRYVVNMCSVIFVNNAGVNRIPGSIAGQVDTGSFGYYG